MKLKSCVRRAAAGALCLMICAAGLCQTVFADDAARAQPPITDFKDEAGCSLTIQYKPHWNSGAEFRLYRVASVDENIKFTPVGMFQSYFKASGLDLNGLDEAYEWDKLAEALKKTVLASEASSGTPAYTKIGKLASPASGRQDAAVYNRGSYAELKFSGLYPGLYLVSGNSYEWKDPADGQAYTYTPNTYLVCIPNWSYNSGTGQYGWTKDVVADARAKASFTTGSQSFLVFKRWVGDGSNAANTRPVSLPIVLYRDGVEYARGTLDAGNNWRLSWTGLPPGTYWARELSVPAGYRNTANYDTFSYTEIVNTYNGGGGGNETTDTQPPVIRPSDPVPPASSPVTYPSSPVAPPSAPVVRPTPPVEIEDPDVPLGNVTPPPSKTDPPEEIELDDPDVPLGDLPQTGQLWWPVPLLAIAGALLILVGLAQRRGAEYDGE